MELAVLLALVLAFTFFVVVSWGSRQTNLAHYWVWSWGLLILAGILLALEPSFITLEVARFATGLFPGLQLAGAFLYAGQRVPSWVFVITAVIAVVRSTVALAGYHDISHMAVLPIELCVLSIGARLVLDRAPHQRDGIDWALCVGGVALCGVETMDALYDLGRIDGSVLWAPWLACGGILGALQVGVVHERIRRVRTERALAAAARQQAVQRLDSLGTLAGGVAHDFNNLLQGIQGNIELALLDLPDDHPARLALARSLKDTDRAATLVKQIRTYAHEQPFDAQPVDLADWFEVRAEFFRKAAGLKHTLDIMVPNDLPKVKADLLQLEQCIVSLIRNAAEAYENGKGKIRLRVEVLEFQTKVPECVIGELRPGQHLRLSVEDYGEGVHADPPSRIFEPFFSTRFIGRGLGLAVTQQIVRAHDGAIDLRTDPSGTLISVYLPALTRAHPELS